MNISNGDFVFSVTEGYLIEDGRLTAPIKTVNLIGNGPEALSKVTLVGTDFKLSDGRWTCGKDGQSVPVGVGMPTVLVSEITVGGTKRIEGIWTCRRITNQSPRTFSIWLSAGEPMKPR